MGIISSCWQWRSQIWHLAITDLVKTCRGAVLGWAWLFIKPAVYIAVFWFALALGLRAGGITGDYPYIVWLASGLIPWFFMADMLNVGSNVYRRYPYLVNKIQFPLPAISAFYGLSKFIIYLASLAIFLLICLVCGMRFSVTIVQIPLIALVMYAFFTCWSIMTSPLSALSKDFANLIKTLSTPLFWLSGIIYNVAALGIDWIQALLAFNPITFFAEANRMALCDGVWLWDRPEVLIPFVGVFVATALVALFVQRRAGSEVADVL